MIPDDLKIIHQPVRLGIMGSLWKFRDLGFAELRDRLALTDGNLGNHARVLEDAGLIEARRVLERSGFVFRYTITAAGKRDFARYLAVLRELVESS